MANAVKVELKQRRGAQLCRSHHERQRRPRSPRAPVALFQQASRQLLARGAAQRACRGHLACKVVQRASDARLVSALGRRQELRFKQPRQLLQARPVRLGAAQPLPQVERVVAERLCLRAGPLQLKERRVQRVHDAEQSAPHLREGRGGVRVA